MIKRLLRFLFQFSYLPRADVSRADFSLWRSSGRRLRYWQLRALRRYRRAGKPTPPRSRGPVIKSRHDAIKSLNRTYQQPAVIPDWVVKANARSLFRRSIFGFSLFGNPKFGRKLKIQLAKAHKAKKKAKKQLRTGLRAQRMVSTRLDKSLTSSFANACEPPFDSKKMSTAAMGSNADQNADQCVSQGADGSDYPELIRSLSDSAYICDCQGRYAEAERLYKNVLQLSIRRYGEGHVALMSPLGELADFFFGQQRYGEAAPLLQQLIELRSHYQSACHPDVADVICQLADTYRYQRHYEDARRSYKEAEIIFAQALGGDHPRTQAVQQRLSHMVAEARLAE